MATAATLSSPICNDDQFLARAMAGNRDALAELFRRHRLVSYRVGFRLLNQEAAALDAVRDGFIKALTTFAFRTECTFKAWLLCRVSDIALERRRSLESLHDVLPFRNAPVRRSFPKWQQAARRREDVLQSIHQALATLPESLRQTLVLHSEGELSYREVAEVTGVSTDEVTNRLVDARRQVRTYLATQHQL
jgi:RNA polymerase sigma-70 factor, ECF subfamily